MVPAVIDENPVVVKGPGEAAGVLPAEEVGKVILTGKGSETGGHPGEKRPVLQLKGFERK